MGWGRGRERAEFTQSSTQCWDAQPIRHWPCKCVVASDEGLLSLLCNVLRTGRYHTLLRTVHNLAFVASNTRWASNISAHRV